MLPTSIKLRNYRAFVGEHCLELRPLTLLYGDNNVGKSALLRLLPLIADSVTEDAAGALKLESEVTYGSGFHDLQWKGNIDDDQDPDLGIGICWPDDSQVRSVDYTLIRKRLRVLVSRCVLQERAQETPLQLDWVPLPDQDAASALSYDYRQASSDPQRTRIEFRGLMPSTPVPALAAVLEPLAAQLAGLRKNVQWLQAKRRASERRMPVPSGLLRSIGSDGGDAAQVLYASSTVRYHVSRWYESAIGRYIDLMDSPPDEFRITLRNARRSQPFEVDLIDSGQGVVQVLPVLVALALAREGNGPRILAVEEPESNLYGGLQLRLCDEICRTVASTAKDVRIVVETHSQQMLLGTQLALLRGDLQPEDVAIYWIHQDEGGKSHADLVTLDEEAFLHGPWPDPFAITRDAARQIIQARSQRVLP